MDPLPGNIWVFAQNFWGKIHIEVETTSLGVVKYFFFTFQNLFDFSNLFF